PDGVSIEGTVRFEDGTPAAGAVVSVGTWGSQKATTNEEGRYRLTGSDSIYFHEGQLEIDVNVGQPPEWTGKTKVTGHYYPGDRITGIDAVVTRSLGWKRDQWMKTKGSAPASA